MDKELPLEVEILYMYHCVQECLNKFYRELPISIRLRAMSSEEMQAACCQCALIFKLFRRRKTFGMALLQVVEKEQLDTYGDLIFCATDGIEDPSDPIWVFLEAIYAELERRENRGELYKKLFAEIGLRNFYKNCLHEPMPGDENVEYVDLPF